MKVKSENFWVQIQIKIDNKHGEYLDILMGKKGRKAHIHQGIKADETILFFEHRNLVNSVKRKMENIETGEVIEKSKIFIKPDENLEMARLKLVKRHDPKTQTIYLEEIHLIEIKKKNIIIKK